MIKRLKNTRMRGGMDTAGISLDQAIKLYNKLENNVNQLWIDNEMDIHLVKRAEMLCYEFGEDVNTRIQILAKLFNENFTGGKIIYEDGKNGGNESVGFILALVDGMDEGGTLSISSETVEKMKEFVNDYDSLPDNITACSKTSQLMFAEAVSQVQSGKSKVTSEWLSSKGFNPRGVPENFKPMGFWKKLFALISEHCVLTDERRTVIKEYLKEEGMDLNGIIPVIIDKLPMPTRGVHISEADRAGILPWFESVMTSDVVQKALRDTDGDENTNSVGTAIFGGVAEKIVKDGLPASSMEIYRGNTTK